MSGDIFSYPHSLPVLSLHYPVWGKQYLRLTAGLSSATSVICPGIRFKTLQDKKSHHLDSNSAERSNPNFGRGFGVAQRKLSAW